MTCVVIAEIGVNHNGDLDTARRLIDGAAAAGAQWAKFQTFRADALVTRSAPKAKYQLERGGGASQFDMLRSLELKVEDHIRLKAHCESQGIGFLSSAFDHQSLELLVGELRLDLIKFGSGELTNSPLLYDAARRGVRMIISTGMATMGEIEAALSTLALGFADEAPDRPTVEAFAAAWRTPALRARVVDRVEVMQCTSAYPCNDDQANLLAMRTIAQTFGVRTGFSDHTLGPVASLAAVALGASAIEKHVTYDRSAPGPDHAASLELKAFADLVRDVRRVEALLGDGIKTPRDIEADTIRVARRSLVALQPIASGERFSAENLGVKRPGGGLSPSAYWSLLGEQSDRAYDADDLIAGSPVAQRRGA